MLGVPKPVTNLQCTTPEDARSPVFLGICVRCHPEQVPKRVLLEVQVRQATARGTIVTCQAPTSIDSITTSTNNNNNKLPPKYQYPSFGGGPSGTITIEHHANQPCPGFERDQSCDGTISILYQVPPGIQFLLKYHLHHGVPYDGKKIRTYLPNTHDGRRLLVRILLAFSFKPDICSPLARRKRLAKTTKPFARRSGWLSRRILYYLDACHCKLDWVGLPKSIPQCLEELAAPTFWTNTSAASPTAAPSAVLPQQPSSTVPTPTDQAASASSQVNGSESSATPLPTPPKNNPQQMFPDNQHTDKALEAQVGIKVVTAADDVSLMDRLDRTQTLLLPSRVETTQVVEGRRQWLLKDRLQYLKDRVFF